ncbi:MAG: nitroreductase family protein [Solirubrobacterales bacterium]|nr:nitroreductase family protein [Solirubrobacterales bacterium]
MDRTAPAEHPIADVLAARWSPRAFSDAPVTRDELHSLLEAARWAPSSGNSQPWRFVYALRDEDPEAHARILGVLDEYNQVWAKDASLLMISVAQLRNEKRELRHAEHDVGLAVGTMLVQATTLGLHVHQMGGYDADAAREALAIPEHHAPVAAIAVGRLGSPSLLPEKLAAREVAERVRVPQAQFAYPGRFGAPD